VYNKFLSFSLSNLHANLLANLLTSLLLPTCIYLLLHSSHKTPKTKNTKPKTKTHTQISKQAFSLVFAFLEVND